MKEKLAAKAHEQWSGWMKYLFENSIKNYDGTVTIPKWAVDRWNRQMNQTYSDLPEAEKDSDRREAEKVLLMCKKLTKEIIKTLEQIAEKDQSSDIHRPWSYTDKCHYCGGVKSFINWLKTHNEPGQKD